jgi:CO/xanthine dehydrogenase Mo-binding subunit
MIDAHARVTGQLELVLNVERPGMLHAAVARSTVPHARVSGIDVSAARAVPGVRAVVTGADVLAMEGIQPRYGPVLRDQPILALDRVRYVGEPVVAIVAEDPEAAAEAAFAVMIEYEDLPAVFTGSEAVLEGAPLLHEPAEHAGPTFADIVLNLGDGHNVCNHFKIRKGDVDAALEAAAHVFEDDFTTPVVQHVALEPHVCVSEFDASGRLTCWSTTQTPHVLVDQLSELLGVTKSQVRVIVPSLGGAYGGKCYAKIEPLTTMLALHTRRPVKLTLTREEEFVTVTKHASEIRLTTGLDGDGRIVARRTRCLFNTGAYADIGPRLIKNGGYGSPGPYAIPHVWVDSYAVFTNLPPAGAFRGYGQQQAAWAYETQMDMIAERLGADPVELRMQNLLGSEDVYHTGEPMGDCHFKDLLAEVTDGVGWSGDPVPVRSGSRVRAKGFACTVKGSVTPSVSKATVRLNDDGSVNVLTSSVEMGQGLKTALAEIVCSRLRVPMEQVHISGVDTAITPYDQQTSSSRSTYCMGNAVLDALAGLEQQLHALASDGAEPGGAGIGELVRRSGRGNLIAHGSFRTEGGLDPETGQGVASAHWHQTAGAAEVEVDLETGVIEILDLHSATYAGRVVSRTLAELQSEGNVAFGVGQALFEQMEFDDGQLVGANLGEYQVVSFADMPRRLHISLMEGGEDADVHGLGETALPAVCPAVGNAVSRAIGMRVTDLPLTPERVLALIRERERAAVGPGS